MEEHGKTKTWLLTFLMWLLCRRQNNILNLNVRYWPSVLQIQVYSSALRYLQYISQRWKTWSCICAPVLLKSLHRVMAKMIKSIVYFYLHIFWCTDSFKSERFPNIYLNDWVFLFKHHVTQIPREHVSQQTRTPVFLLCISSSS